MAEFDSEPDYACPDCFADPWLREFVEDESTHRGDCPSCESPGKPLVPVHKLYEPFRNLMSSYKPAAGPPMESGEPIVMLIQDHWEVFSDDLVASNREGALLEAIMDSGWDDDSGESRLSAYDHYVDTPWYHETLDQIWEEFAYEVKQDPTRPLQFKDADFDDFLIREELLGRRTVPLPAGNILYRARPGFAGDPEDPKPHTGSEIGAPPPEKARPGRANAEGKIVLYCADQEGTAVAEVRPARGEYVSATPQPPPLGQCCVVPGLSQQLPDRLLDLKVVLKRVREASAPGHRIGSDACAPKWRQAGSQRTLVRPDQGPSSPNSIAAQRLDQTRLGRGQELTQHRVHINADNVATRCEPDLPLAGKQHLPGFMLLAADQGVLAVGAALPIGSGFAPGAGQAVVPAGFAVFGPSAGLEVPAAESPDPFFAAFSSTCRSVNSWKKRSPTG